MSDIIPPATPDDLPELPGDLAAELEGLTPEAFVARPTVAGPLTLDSVRPMRLWAADGLAGEELMPEDVIDQSVAGWVDFNRDHGVDVYDRKTLLDILWTTQLFTLELQRSARNCGAGPDSILHTMVHVSQPILNMNVIFERVIAQVFTEDERSLAPDTPEGGE